MPADMSERIIDESYKAVFPLGKEQTSSHLCSESNRKLQVMRVRLELDETAKTANIVTESTDGKALIQVKEPASAWQIKNFPFDVNPSESPKNILDTPRLIPLEVLDDVSKGFPKRKNFQKHKWQKAAVFSFQDDKIEVGRSDKQGQPIVDKFEGTTSTAFPPVEEIFDANKVADAKVTIRLEVPLLKKLIEAVERTGTEFVNLSLWGSDRALLVQSVNLWGSKTVREVSAFLMPVGEKKA